VALTTPATAHARPNEGGRVPSGLPTPGAEDAGEGPWGLLAPVGPGDHLGGGWIARTLSAVSHGAAIVTLAHPSGASARVHVCKRAGSPRGVACTEHLDFMLMNGGDGRAPTDEELSRAVKTLAMRIAQEDAQRDRPRPGGLLSHPARLGWFGNDGVLE
jgi:hypothetical protein